MEQHLGRPLTSEELIHHVNGDGTDNRIENLQVVSRSEHMGIHKASGDLGERGQATTRWSHRYPCCRECGRTDRRHAGHGFCNTCRQRLHSRKAS
jgi:hypothetical protein